MPNRPWVTPEDVKAYTDYSKVQGRQFNKLVTDILRAEMYVINYTNNTFEDNEKYPIIPESIKVAVILIAEMYAKNAVENKGEYKSESFDDYSYTIADTTVKLDNLLLAPLLDRYIISESRNGVIMKLRKL